MNVEERALFVLFVNRGVRSAAAHSLSNRASYRGIAARAVILLSGWRHCRE